MYQGKYTSRAVRRRQKRSVRRRPLRLHPALASLCCTAVLLLGITGGSLAYLSAFAEEVRNEFTYAYVTTSVGESFDGVSKEHVTVSNQGNADAYIRARVVISWKDEQGNVYPFPPDSGDYSIQYGSDWTLRDGCWYYNRVVPANGKTTDLIRSCTCETVKTVTENAQEHTYFLCVEILAEGIQAEGAVNTGGMGTMDVSAMEHAWGSAQAATD